MTTSSEAVDVALDAIPVYLSAGADPVFSIFHPAAGVSGGIGVLICPPFGNGDVCSFRPRRDWAELLARSGHPTLRIDLPGTGDSGGGPHDDCRFAGWIDAVNAAAAWLRKEAGTSRVACIGIELGGLIAYMAASQSSLIEDLVLWGVFGRGRDHVRALRAFSRLETSWADSDAIKREQSGNDASAPGDESLRAGGFALSAETVRALRDLDLTKLKLPGATTRRVLLLERDGIGVDERLRGFLQSTGAELTVAPGPGYGQMMAEPYESRSPTAVFASVAAWLDDAKRSSRSDEEEPELAISELGISVPRAALPGDPGIEASAEIVVGSARIRETPIAIEHPSGRLVSVLSEPLRASDSQMGVVFLNAGAVRRIGPNRMWVEAARRFAAAGVPTLRIDLAGIGDAEGDDSGWADDANVYTHDFVTQACAAVDAMVTRGVAERFVLAGLCSGAYWAFHAALEHERVTGAIMLNPRVFFWETERQLLKEAGHARKLLRTQLWLKVVRGDLSPRRMGVFVRAVLLLVARMPLRLLRRAQTWRTGGDRLDHALDRLNAAGKHVTIVFGPQELLRLELEASRRLGSIAQRANVQVELLDGDHAAHTLVPISLQRQVHEQLDRALGRELDRTRSKTPSLPGPDRVHVSP